MCDNTVTSSRYSFSTIYISFWNAVFCEVTHGMFTFNAAPFNSVYFLSVLAVHMYTVEDGDRYEDAMLDFISQLGRNERKCIFQQDGARANTKSTIIDFLGPFSGKCLTGLNLVPGVEWPPRSPGLSKFQIFQGHPLNSLQIKDENEEWGAVDKSASESDLVANGDGKHTKRARVVAEGPHFQITLACLNFWFSPIFFGKILTFSSPTTDCFSKQTS